MNFTFEGVSKKLKAPFWNPFELDKKHAMAVAFVVKFK